MYLLWSFLFYSNKIYVLVVSVWRMWNTTTHQNKPFCCRYSCICATGSSMNNKNQYPTISNWHTASIQSGTQFNQSIYNGTKLLKYIIYILNNIVQKRSNMHNRNWTNTLTFKHILCIYRMMRLDDWMCWIVNKIVKFNWITVPHVAHITSNKLSTLIATCRVPTELRSSEVLEMH